MWISNTGVRACIVPHGGDVLPLLTILLGLEVGSLCQVVIDWLPLMGNSVQRLQPGVLSLD